jgi:aspartate carbamoyltransferase catalytic subunit
MTELTRLRSRHLLGITDLGPDEIELILNTAEAMKEIGTRTIKKVPALRGRTVVNLFFEASTRTRLSFELAEKRLSADTMGVTAVGSSVSKPRAPSRPCPPTSSSSATRRLARRICSRGSARRAS